MALVHYASAVALSVAAASAGAGTLTIYFLHPETYTDGTYSGSLVSERDRQEVQSGLARHLESLAERELPAGMALDIEVINIDLAGRVEPLRTFSNPELRVIRDVDWPRMTMRYTLKRGDRVVLREEDKVADMNFQRSVNPYAPGDRLRYEKAMLDRWFAQRFSAEALARANG